MLEADVGPISSTWRASSSWRCFNIDAQPVEWRGIRGPTKLTRASGAGSGAVLPKRLRSALRANGVFLQMRWAFTAPEHLSFRFTPGSEWLRGFSAKKRGDRVPDQAK